MKLILSILDTVQEEIENLIEAVENRIRDTGNKESRYALTKRGLEALGLNETEITAYYAGELIL